MSSAFQYGWTKLQQHFGQIIIAIAAWVGVMVVFGLVAFFINSALVSSSVDCTDTAFGRICSSESIDWWKIGLSFGIWALFWFLGYFVGSYLIIRAALAITAGRPLTKEELLNWDNFTPYFLTSLVAAVIIGVLSLVSCGLLGLVAIFFFFFAQYYSAERGYGPAEALRSSVTVMNRNLARMVVFFIGAYIAQFIGTLLCLVGLLVAVPVVIIASAYMYRTANGELVAH